MGQKRLTMSNAIATQTIADIAKANAVAKSGQSVLECEFFNTHWLGNCSERFSANESLCDGFIAQASGYIHPSTRVLAVACLIQAHTLASMMWHTHNAVYSYCFDWAHETAENSPIDIRALGEWLVAKFAIHDVREKQAHISGLIREYDLTESEWDELDHLSDNLNAELTQLTGENCYTAQSVHWHRHCDNG